MDESKGSRAHRPELPTTFAHRGSERQVQIRRAALELFAARGYAGTTIDDIGARAGIRGPSVYKHVDSKHALLVSIMEETMDVLLENQQQALLDGNTILKQFRLMVSAHVRYHAGHASEAFVGTREIDCLDQPFRSVILGKRREYDLTLRNLIEHGIQDGIFHNGSPRLASYSILDMGMGVSVWYRPEGPIALDELVEEYVDIALRVVGYRRRRAKAGTT